MNTDLIESAEDKSTSTVLRTVAGNFIIVKGNLDSWLKLVSAAEEEVAGIWNGNRP